MIRVKFFRLDPFQAPGGTGQPAEITVQTDDVDKAYEAAVDVGGDWTRKMKYQFVEP